MDQGAPLWQGGSRCPAMSDCRSEMAGVPDSSPTRGHCCHICPELDWLQNEDIRFSCSTCLPHSPSVPLRTQPSPPVIWDSQPPSVFELFILGFLDEQCLEFSLKSFHELLSLFICSLLKGHEEMIRQRLNNKVQWTLV